MTEAKDRRMAFGRSGETLAAGFLERSGYTITARNWRCKLGEIDIVARRGEELVFVEVRTRSNTKRFGTPAESVDVRKQARLRGIARLYLQAHGLGEETAVRFDVVDIRWNTVGGQPAIRHITGAF